MLIHFAERELFELPQARRSEREIDAAFDRLTRLALLFSPEQCVMPASGFFETNRGYRLVREFAPAVERGRLRMLGSEPRAARYVERKSGAGGFSAKAYSKIAAARLELAESSWEVKPGATEGALFDDWRAALANGRHPLTRPLSEAASSLRAERELDRLPERLDGAAMLAGNLLERLSPQLRGHVREQDEHALRAFLARGFFASYAGSRWGPVIRSPQLADPRHFTPHDLPCIDEQRLLTMLDMLGLERRLLAEMTVEQLVELSVSAEWQAMASVLLPRATRYPVFSPDEVVRIGHARSQPGAQAPRWRQKRSQLVSSTRQMLTILLAALETPRMGRWGNRAGAGTAISTLRSDTANLLNVEQQMIFLGAATEQLTAGVAR